MGLTNNERLIIDYMKNEKPYGFTPYYADYAIDGLTDRGYYVIMANLEKKGLVLREYKTEGNYSYFCGYYIKT